MNKRNGTDIVCGNSRSNGASSCQRPIVTCLSEAKDHQPPLNYNVNQMMQSQNQQHQVIFQ